MANTVTPNMTVTNHGATDMESFPSNPLDLPSASSSSETSSLLDSSESSGNSNPVSYGIYSPLSPDLEADWPPRASNSVEAGLPPSQSDPAQATITQVILVLLIGVFTSNADGSLVLATHPIIASEFDLLEDSSWLFISFALAGAATQSLYAKLSDIYGRKSLLLWSYLLFALGCTLVGVGQAYWQVILGRIISGSGAAGMTTLVAVFITDLVPLREVASWQAYLNIVATTGRSLGGPVGGFLADTVGWRWSFLGQGPLFLVALVLCWVILPDSRAPTTRVQAAPDSGVPAEANDKKTSRLARIDFLGAGLLGLAILALMIPLEIGGSKVPWTHPLIFALAGAGGVLLALFLATEAWWAQEPVFPLVLLGKRDVVASYMIAGCQIAAQMGLMFSVPLYFQVTARASNTVAGAHLFPAVLGNAVGGMMTGHLIQRTGRYRSLIILGTLCSSSSYLILMLRWHGSTSWLESMEIIPSGFGTGIAQAAVFIGLQAAIDPEHKATAAAGFFLSFPIGMTIGMAITSAVMLGGMRATLELRLSQLGLRLVERREIIAKAVSSVDYLDQVEGDIYQTVVAAYVDGLWRSHGVSLGFALLAFLWALFLRQHKI